MIKKKTQKKTKKKKIKKSRKSREALFAFEMGVARTITHWDTFSGDAYPV